MSNIKSLIHDLCLSGVEFHELKTIVTIKNGKDYKHLGEGNIPVYGSGGIMTYVNEFVYNKPSVLIPRKGSLNKLYYTETPFWNVDTIFYTEINEDMISPKFLYYFLQTQHLENLNNAGGVPSLTQTILNRIQIPVPSLAIQEEIVRILDNFTNLKTDLETELEGRKQQFEYYLNKILLLENKKVQNKTIKDICKIERGKVYSKDYLRDNKGEYPVYSSQTANNGELGKIQTYNYDGEYLTWTTDGAYAGTIFHRKGKFSITNVCGLLELKDQSVMLRFLYYYLSLRAKDYVYEGMGNPKLMSNQMEKIVVSIPSIDIQQEIIQTLDKFYELKEALEMELKMRVQQYEYYRDKLLTFKRAE